MFAVNYRYGNGKLLQIGKEFGLEGEKLLDFVEKQQKLGEEKEEKRRKREEGRKKKRKKKGVEEKTKKEKLCGKNEN